ncbi:MAG: hypothetical protein HQ575_05220 [Candidatus Omnitrophica bacterium]|nr:hypothetical protein [Candidatus Omnitrophota bacterium]
MEKKIPYKITEEIVRFAFEVYIGRFAKKWSILFTNPTAGPWKKIVLNTGETSMEIGRYKREEKRPDLILFLKDPAICIVVEAKDAFNKINNEDQIEKSFSVFKKERKRIQEHSAFNTFINKDIHFINSYLWYDTTAKNIDTLKNSYFRQHVNEGHLLCIVGTKKDGNLCFKGELVAKNEALLNKKVAKAIEELFQTS